MAISGCTWRALHSGTIAFSEEMSGEASIVLIELYNIATDRWRWLCHGGPVRAARATTCAGNPTAQ